MPKTTEVLLKEYGYTEVQEGLFIPERPSSERWERVEGGWQCYGMGRSMGGGAPWGTKMDGGALFKIPYTQKPSFATAGGLHPAANAEAFDFIWPDKVVNDIYAHVSKPGEGNEWVRQDDGSFKKA